MYDFQYHLRRTMASLSRNSYDMPGLDPRMEKVCPSVTQLSKKNLEYGHFTESLKSSVGKFYGRYGDLINQYKVPPPLTMVKYHSVAY